MRPFLIVATAAALGAAAPLAPAQDLARSRQTAIVTAAARVAPAVVSVNVLRRERQVATDPFDLFFMPRGYERTVEGYGSGFIVSPDGVVITNQHVTQGAERIVVTTRDGRDFPAKRLGEDPVTDIAVLKVDGSSLPTARSGRRRAGGLRVTELAPGGPAAGAGIAQGDVLVSAKGHRLRTFLDWEAVLLDTGPGDTVVVSYRHGAQVRTARLPVNDLPTSRAEKVSILGGMQVITVTPAIQAERNIQADHGALIHDISEEMQQATGLQ